MAKKAKATKKNTVARRKPGNREAMGKSMQAARKAQAKRSTKKKVVKKKRKTA